MTAMYRIAFGVSVVIVSVLLAFLIIAGIAMTDGPVPQGWDLWSQLWPAYIGFAVGVAIIVSRWAKWRPWQ
jgi:hypothetical protein